MWFFSILSSFNWSHFILSYLILSYSPSLFLSVRLMPRHVRKSVMLQPLLLLALRGRILRWWGEKLISYCLFLISYDITASSSSFFFFFFFFFFLMFLLHFTSLHFIFIFSFLLFHPLSFISSHSSFHFLFFFSIFFYFSWYSLISSSCPYSSILFYPLLSSSIILSSFIFSSRIFSHLPSSPLLFQSPLLFSSVSAWCGCCSS